MSKSENKETAAMRIFQIAGMSLLLSTGLACAETLTHQQIINTLGQVSGDAPAIDPSLLTQEVEANLGKGAADLPGWNQLDGLAQINLEINFEYNSPAIEPESYRNVGLVAEALHHPILANHKFLIVGHTDATGNPQYNLKLSQKRAEAIKDSLSTTFGISPNRLFIVGVGEELPVDAAHPDAAHNRRVHVINIGRVK